MEKCNSSSLAFPATKFYIREMAASIANAERGNSVLEVPGKVLLGPFLSATTAKKPFETSILM